MLPKLFKRCPYRNYSKVEDKISIVLEHIRKENLERGELSNISRTTGIPLATIIRWRKNILEDPAFNPTKTKHGQHLRIFTDYEENELCPDGKNIEVNNDNKKQYINSFYLNFYRLNLQFFDFIK